MPAPCFRNPDYRNWWLSVAEDQAKSHPVAGLYYSSERSTPLTSALGGASAGDMKDANAPGCFCEFCQAQASKLGIDIERAREGFRQLLEFNRSGAGRERGAENAAVVWFRLLLRYPEVAAWETLWMQGYLGLLQQIYGTVKAINPELAVGRAVSSQSSVSPLYRALDDLSESARFSDFLCLSPSRPARTEAGFAGISAGTTGTFLDDVLGYSDTGPVEAEIGRAVAATRGALPVYLGVAAGNVADDIAAALRGRAGGLIYPPEFVQNSSDADLKAAGTAVMEMGELSVA